MSDPKSGLRALPGSSVLLSLTLLLLASASRLDAQPLRVDRDGPDGPSYLAAQVLVQFKSSASDAELTDAVKRAGLATIKYLPRPGQGLNKPGLAQMWSSLPVAATIQLLQHHPAVEFVEPNWVNVHQDLPSDSYFTAGQLWGMESGTSSPANVYGSHAVDAWQAGKIGSSSVVVGVVDEGIESDHPDLAANIWTNPGETAANGADDDNNTYIDDVHGWNALDNNGTIFTPGADAHGTHVSGTIGAVANNGGVVGVNWAVNIVSGKFLGPNGGTTADAVEAINYLTALKQQQGVHIVALNNSWGGGGYSQGLVNAIADAAKADILFIAAAGNGDAAGRAINTDSRPFYPACYDTTSLAGYNSVISVTAIDSTGNKASWANYGALTVDLGAPGVNIFSTLPVGTWGAYSGTSMATPHVTGAVALYASMFYSQFNRYPTGPEMRSAILAATTATPSLAGKTVTGGRLDITKLVQSLSAPAAPTGLSATPGNGRVDLHWNAAAGALGYDVKRGTSGGSYDTVTHVTSTTYADTSVHNGTTYYYLVTAVNSIGSADSSEVFATPNGPPAAPTNLTATAVSKSQINLSWKDNSSNETGFAIERSSNGKSFSQIDVTQPGVISYQSTGLSRNSTYYFRVRALNGIGYSAYSNTANARTASN